MKTLVISSDTKQARKAKQKYVAPQVVFIEVRLPADKIYSTPQPQSNR